MEVHEIVLLALAFGGALLVSVLAESIGSAQQRQHELLAERKKRRRPGNDTPICRSESSDRIIV